MHGNPFERRLYLLKKVQYDSPQLFFFTLKDQGIPRFLEGPCSLCTDCGISWVDYRNRATYEDKDKV